MKRSLLFGLCATVFLSIAGCGTTSGTGGVDTAATKKIVSLPRKDVPTLSEVKSVEVNANFPGVPNLKFNPNTQSGRKQISNILNWLSASKPDGIESNHRMPNLGPTEVDIYTTDGRQIQVTQAWEPQGNALVRSNDYVVLYTGGNNKPIHLYSPNLAQWLFNGWKSHNTGT